MTCLLALASPAILRAQTNSTTGLPVTMDPQRCAAMAKVAIPKATILSANQIAHGAFMLAGVTDGPDAELGNNLLG